MPLFKLSIFILLFFCILHHHNLFTSASYNPHLLHTSDFLTSYSLVERSSYHDRATPHISTSSISKLRIKALDPKNRIATYVTIVIVLLNILVFKLREHREEVDLVEHKSRSANFGHGCRLFSIREIHIATNNFDDALVLGKGGFGKVYKGLIDGGANSVAVKRLNSNSRQGAREFWTEIEMLSKFRHSHLVSLIGYCNDDHEMILVYEYMLNGTLSDHLYKNDRNVANTLSWEQRLKVCIGAARGLDYLHTGTGVRNRVIHRDVKCSNILLDENWEAKISDFGLSKIGPSNQAVTDVSTKVRGTIGYLDPEYFFTHRLTRKSDVYAFGVVLFAVLCGRPAVDFSVDEDQHALARCAPRHIKEGTLNQIIDSRIRSQISPACLKVFSEVADKCLDFRLDKRPTMADVVVRLERALESQLSTEESSMEEYAILLASCGEENNNANASHSSTGDENDVDEINPPNASVPASQFNTSTVTTKKNTHKYIGFMTRVKNIWKKKTVSWANSTEEDYTISKTVSEQSIRFSFKELEIATINFTVRLGSFTCKGVLSDGSQVAVTNFSDIRIQQKELLRAISVMGSIHHLHLLRLKGFCIEGTNNRLLVYEYMDNSSLDKWIFDKSEANILNWSTRYEIALGIAKGLVYLHEDCHEKLIHGDIRPRNVILDDNFVPKLSNFYHSILMRKGQRSEYTTTMIGSMGYLAPEWIMNYGHCISEKIDVYSYGMMLIEIVCCRRNFEPSENSKGFLPLLYAFKKVKNGKVRDILVSNVNDDEIESVCTAMKVAFWCVQEDQALRPTMSKVVQMLECISPVPPPPNPFPTFYSSVSESISESDSIFEEM